MKITETSTYEESIYQIELTDPVIGGADGIANLQAKQLANRTNWLKAVFEKVVDGTTSIAKALKLATARKISLGGALSGNANFDGSADITIEASFADGVLTINSIQGLSTALNGKQANDVTLTALANLTTAANKLIYATASDTFATTDLTAFARTLLAGGDAATMRSTLGALGGMSANDVNVKEALNAIGAAPIYACRARVNFNGTGIVAIRTSGNISSVADNGVGTYALNFIIPMPDTNYNWAGNSIYIGGGNSVSVQESNSISRSVSSFQIITYAAGGTPNPYDTSIIMVEIF